MLLPVFSLLTASHKSSQGAKTREVQTNITVESSPLGEIITALSLLQQTNIQWEKTGPL